VDARDHCKKRGETEKPYEQENLNKEKL